MATQSDTTNKTLKDLFNYVDSNGIVIPDTSAVQDIVKRYFAEKIGDINFAPETIMGRIIEALTVTVVNVIGVNALNANSLNISTAVGAWLDNIGALFKLPRLPNQTDTSYRKAIMESNSRGSGFAASIRNAISDIVDVTHVCVLENGCAYPIVSPVGSLNGVAVDSHSVYIVVNGGDENDIAKAIYNNKSLGCGYQHQENIEGEYGKKVSIQVDDNSSTVVFYRPVEVEFELSITVINDLYTGKDIVSDVKNSVVSFLSTRTINTVITKGEILASISQNSNGAAGLSINIIRKGKNENNEITYSNADTITLRPCQYANITGDDITVTVE